MKSFPFYKQPESMDCGPTCIRIICKYYGKLFSLEELRKISHTSREGSSLLGLSDAAEKVGFKTFGVKISFSQMQKEKPFPCIAHWNQKHYVVVYKIHGNTIYVSDPAHGLLKYSKDDFLRSWVSDGEDEGILLLLEPQKEFFKEDKGLSEEPKRNFSFLFNYIRPYTKLISQLILGLLVGSLLQLTLPFLTQAIIDIGVQNNDLDFIYLILFAQLLMFLGRTSIEILRGFILMHISSRINISLVSDFFIKLMKLPISYFDTKMTGDILQRINDHERIESFLTATTLNTIFSMFNLVVFCTVLAFYNLTILGVFLTGSIFYFLWIVFFLKRRADIDYKRFQQSSQNQSKTLELITGMQEIKLHNAERQKRWQWESIQAKLFKINLKSLSLSQMQNSGSSLINELKNIIITFLAAKLVLDGQISLGVMLSISYIIGQLNSPILELVGFVQHWQNAKLSLERLNEIHAKKNEEPSEGNFTTNIQTNKDIFLKNLSFKYDSLHTNYVLKDLNLLIPAKKVTAIVGASGSGKTTLMKLLLKFYEPLSGEIQIAETNLNAISPKAWREKCGTVMQEGYIFNDSIANNIAIGNDEIDLERLKYSVKIANIQEHIESLPLNYNTKIGMEGVGLSTGQKQRILIARAVYRNPEMLFFDEATSALDSNNEKIIMNNLTEFFKDKTVVVIAHRLSTVKNADQIVVLDKGKIIELGSHSDLTKKRGEYYELVKNQLELA